ncbi:MAG: hypothetical protein SV186_02195 [Candidatus Nanohaloarchaea archaeon]|nr:hypothetical protein [Candidatus Nanohaloarchaea archaeon]
MDYEDVLQVIIQEEEKTVGDLATQRAALLDCIETSSGEISFTRTPTAEDVEKLIDVFKEIQGKGAIGIARRALKGRLTSADDLDLPAEIIPTEVKEQDFITGL